MPSNAVPLPPSLRVLERGWLSSNQILLFDDDGATVVDTGYVTEVDDTLRLIDQALAGRPLKRIVNTHLHSDHAGGNAALQDRHDCVTWIPPGESEAAAVWDEDRLSYRPTSQQCPRFRFDALVHPHQTLHLGGEDWTVLPAEGHDDAMVMLWCDRQGVLVSADALWEKGFGVIFPELVGEAGFEAQAATLALIADLAPRVVIPGHGAPFTAVQPALEAAQARLNWLRNEPVKHAEYALKVLVSFKLMEARSLSQSAIEAIVQAAFDRQPALAALYAGREVAAVARDVVAQLARSGAVQIRLDGGIDAPAR
ncbi:MBL fold metallo-hydrolase [uncultured Aquabacterium sp.]|uniref:MBL fold metallo-hydrolase n=1 Tax=uncultured Aquabacterium sp. TaxID=158753 RepID=UPI0025D3F4F3|nr:MBL fold metallo-hydrolase [uncultured Aquabacterium sp.]